MLTGLHPPTDLGLAHARAVRARGLTMPPEGLPSSSILDSWARCVDLGLVPGDPSRVPVVDAADLAYRRDRSELVRRLAQAELETLSKQIAGSNFLLAFADQEGVILDVYADNRFSMSSDDAAILPGSQWTESLAGTSGIGTALAMGSAIAVTGLEHYFLKLGQISCTAAPVRDAFGKVVGVLDASSHYESRQRHTQALVQMAATHIENGLLAHQMHGQLVLALHPRAEFLGTLSAGLLAFDTQGCLLAINGPGRHLLAGLTVRSGTRFDALFCEPLDHVLARFHRHREVKLRDALGSVLTARAVSHPPAKTLLGAAHTASFRLPARHEALPIITRPTLPLLAGGRLPKPVDPIDSPVRFVADDLAMVEACRLIEAAVRMRVPVLLQGETGTGKEVMARYAHQCSGRTGAFVAVNCAAIPADLFEAELFGYVGGAYTGARREGSPGLVLAADGGTLLLDEVRELPASMQAALLRFLDDHSVRAVGGQTSRRVDVQLIAATHADLDAEVIAKTFRQDLLYRLDTVKVTLPPLRVRSDFAPVVRWVLESLDPFATITDDAVRDLATHRWPGNFRELRSIITRALLARPATSSGHPLDSSDVMRVFPHVTGPGPASDAPKSGSMLQRSAGAIVRTAYEQNGRSVTRTSRALGISRTTVYRHLQEPARSSHEGKI